MLCRQKCWGADYVFQEFNAQVLQVGVPLKVLSHTHLERNAFVSRV